jgi:hypothetical protein
MPILQLKKRLLLFLLGYLAAGGRLVKDKVPEMTFRINPALLRMK